jgi:DNA-binding NarL/FixJ family response regulator
VSIRVALIDDHPIVIGGVEAALASVKGIDVVARAGTMGDARVLLSRDDIDVILLDVRLEDGNGLQLLADRPIGAGPAVLVVSTFTTSQYVAASARFGAAGFLGKTVPLDTLVDAIRTVATGGSVFTTDQLRKAFVSLTPREREVLRLAMEGLSNKEIGAKLGAAPKTIEGHLSDIFGKYGIAGGRIELSIRAASEGWLEIVPPGVAERRRRD